MPKKPATRIETGPAWELRLGRWQDVLADVMPDALITDPPYSARTHEGHNDAVESTTGAPHEVRPWPRSDGRVELPVKPRRAIGFDTGKSADVRTFCRSWGPRTSGWLCAMTSHDLARHYDDALTKSGRYVFSPLPLYSPGSRVRLTGDGPSSWTCWMIVARPRTRAAQQWGTLPGGYVYPPEPMPVVGGKPVGLMRAIVRDYSRVGDLVCDPCAGGATTLLAAVMEGRRAIGAEMDPATFELAVERLRRGVQVGLPGVA
jgi:hypothetical protein